MKSIVELRKKFPNLIDKEEALKRGIEIREDWRNVEKGDFICTIDGVVLEILKTSEKKHYNGQKPTKHIHTEIGRFPVTIRCVYAKRIPLNDDGNLLGSRHLRTVFVQEMCESGIIGANGKFTPQSIIENYMTIYSDNNEVNALIRGRKILKLKHVRKYMSINMKEAFETLNWDIDKVAGEYIALYEGKKVSAIVKKQILDKINESLDIKMPDDPKQFPNLLKGVEPKKLKKASIMLAMLDSYEAQGKIIDVVFFEEFTKSVKLLKE